VKFNPWSAMASAMIIGGCLYLAHLLFILEIVGILTAGTLVIWAVLIAWDGVRHWLGRRGVLLCMILLFTGFGAALAVLILAVAFPYELVYRHRNRARPPVLGPQMAPQTTGGQR
jgi:hypothetical protein